MLNVNKRNLSAKTRLFRFKNKKIAYFLVSCTLCFYPYLFYVSEEGFGLSKTEIGGIIGGLTFLIVAITLAVIAVVCNRRRSRKQRPTKYSKLVNYLRKPAGLAQLVSCLAIRRFDSQVWQMFLHGNLVIRSFLRLFYHFC